MTIKTQSIFLFYMQFNANTTRDRADNDDIAEPTMRTSITTIITPRTMLTINPIRAPFPAVFASAGLVFFQTKYKIKPTTGRKKPKTAHPAEPSELALVDGVCEPTGQPQ